MEASLALIPSQALRDGMRGYPGETDRDPISAPHLRILHRNQGLAAGELCQNSAVEWKAAMGRRTVMRPWTLPILGAVAVSLAVPSNAGAGPRFGPGTVL